MAGSLKISLVVLSGLAITLSACNQISDRSMATPTIATPSNHQAKQNAASYSTASSQKQSQEKSTIPDTGRKDYKPISLAKIGKADALAGSEPKELALSVFAKTESEGGSLRDVTVNYPQTDQAIGSAGAPSAIVTITENRVADDSIGGIRYRVELVRSQSAPTAKSWKIVWAGSQFKCKQGRGHQDWSTELCL